MDCKCIFQFVCICTASQVALAVPMLGDVRDTGSIPGLGRSPGGGHGNPLQYSCLENPMDKGAWQAMILGVTNSQTWLKWLSIHTHSLHICLYSIYTKIIYVHISKHIHMYTHVIYHNIYVIGPNFHNLLSEVLLPPFYPWENVIKKRVWGFFKLLNVTQLDHSEFREFTFWYKQHITAKFKENGFLWLFYGNLIMNLNFYGEREVMVEGEILAQNWTWWLWDQRVSGCPWNSGNPSWRTRHCGQKLTREIHWLAKI